MGECKLGQDDSNIMSYQIKGIIMLKPLLLLFTVLSLFSCGGNEKERKRMGIGT